MNSGTAAEHLAAIVLAIALHPEFARDLDQEAAHLAYLFAAAPSFLLAARVQLDHLADSLAVSVTDACAILDRARACRDRDTGTAEELALAIEALTGPGTP